MLQRALCERWPPPLQVKECVISHARTLVIVTAGNSRIFGAKMQRSEGRNVDDQQSSHSSLTLMRLEKKDGGHIGHRTKVNPCSTWMLRRSALLTLQARPGNPRVASQRGAIVMLTKMSSTKGLTRSTTPRSPETVHPANRLASSFI